MLTSYFTIWLELTLSLSRQPLACTNWYLTYLKFYFEFENLWSSSLFKSSSPKFLSSFFEVKTIWAVSLGKNWSWRCYSCRGSDGFVNYSLFLGPLELAHLEIASLASFKDWLLHYWWQSFMQILMLSYSHYFLFDSTASCDKFFSFLRGIFQ